MCSGSYIDEIALRNILVKAINSKRALRAHDRALESLRWRLGSPRLRTVLYARYLKHLKNMVYTPRIKRGTWALGHEQLLETIIAFHKEHFKMSISSQRIAT